MRCWEAECRANDITMTHRKEGFSITLGFAFHTHLMNYYQSCCSEKFINIYWSNLFREFNAMRSNHCYRLGPCEWWSHRSIVSKGRWRYAFGVMKVHCSTSTHRIISHTVYIPLFLKAKHLFITQSSSFRCFILPPASASGNIFETSSPMPRQPVCHALVRYLYRSCQLRAERAPLPGEHTHFLRVTLNNRYTLFLSSMIYNRSSTHLPHSIYQDRRLY